jgi:hypothetical protein
MSRTAFKVTNCDLKLCWERRRKRELVANCDPLWESDFHRLENGANRAGFVDISTTSPLTIIDLSCDFDVFEDLTGGAYPEPFLGKRLVEQVGGAKVAPS